MEHDATVKAVARLVTRWIGMTSGAGSLMFGVFMLYRSAMGNAVPPRQGLVIIGWVAFVTFVLSAGASWWFEYKRAGTNGDKAQLARFATQGTALLERGKRVEGD